MRLYKHGWCTCIMLIVMGILTLLAINSYQASLYVLRLARARYHNHQHMHLIEGLLQYGVAVCKENKELLIRWGMQDEQSMSMRFDPWPSTKLVDVYGHYIGLISIMSRYGLLYVNAQLVSKKRTILTGLCTMQLKDIKDLKSELLITSWHTA